MRTGTPTSPRSTGTGRARKVVLGLALTAAVLIVPSFAVLQWLARTHPAYDQALRVIRTDRDVARRLGSPLDAGLWVSGKSWHGHAGLEFVVFGPKGHADVSVTAKREDGDWRLTRLLWRSDGRWRSIVVASE